MLLLRCLMNLRRWMFLGRRLVSRRFGAGLAVGVRFLLGWPGLGRCRMGGGRGALFRLLVDSLRGGRRR